MSEPTTLGEALPLEQARVRRLITVYRDLPDGVGSIGATLMELTLQEADQAVASGDVVAMMVAYERLKGCE